MSNKIVKLVAITGLVAFSGLVYMNAMNLKEKSDSYYKEAESRINIDRTIAMQIASAVIMHKEKHPDKNFSGDRLFKAIFSENLVHYDTASSLSYNFELYGNPATHVGYTVLDKDICKRFNKDMKIDSVDKLLESPDVTVSKNGQKRNYMSCVKAKDYDGKFVAIYKIDGTKVGERW